MKSKLIKICGALLAVLALSSSAIAGPISGAITFAGSVTLNTGNAGTATSVTSWIAPTVEDVDGDFASTVNSGDAVSFVAPWSFNTNTTIPSFWSVGGFSFDLHSSSIIFQTTSGNGSVLVTGTGTVSGNNFDPTSGAWSFTTQGPAANGTFSFSASAGVPDNGMTAVLLGTSLLAMGIVGFRRKTA